MIKAVLALGSYLTGVWVLLVMFCILPSRALALVSNVAFSRVVAQAEWIAYQAATRTAAVSAVSSAAAVTSPASIAIRAVTGPVGWAALGVTAAVILYQTYYPAGKLSELKEEARSEGAPMVGAQAVFAPYDLGNGTVQCWNHPEGAQYGQACGYQKAAHCTTFATSCTGHPVPTGWVLAWCSNMTGNCESTRPNLGATALVVAPGPDPSVAEVAAVLDALPPADPLSIESNSIPLGKGVTPDSASSVSSVPVSPTEMPTTVKPSSEVVPTDILVKSNVPPEQGATSTGTQTTTTTTTTTTNPDGSETTEEETTFQCEVGANHDQRSFEGIFLEPRALWMATGFLGMLSVIQALSWPETLGSYTMDVGIFGTHTLDFNDYAWLFTILRTFVIFFATFLGYRIIWG